MNVSSSGGLAVAAACLSLVWGVLSTLLWLWIVLRVLAALERFARAHANLARAIERIAERLPDRNAASAAGAVEADWLSRPPDDPAVG
jgi:hypothetical protein